MVDIQSLADLFSQQSYTFYSEEQLRKLNTDYILRSFYYSVRRIWRIIRNLRRDIMNLRNWALMYTTPTELKKVEYTLTSLKLPVINSGLSIKVSNCAGSFSK